VGIANSECVQRQPIQDSGVCRPGAKPLVWVSRAKPLEAGSIL